MSVTEHDRHRLYTWFEEHMGPERANTLMNLVPPVGWGDVATKRDLDVQTTLAKGDITELRSELKGDIAELRSELKGDIAGLEQRMNDRFAHHTRTFVTWLFASQAAVIAAMAVFFALD